MFIYIYIYISYDCLDIHDNTVSIGKEGKGITEPLAVKFATTPGGLNGSNPNNSDNAYNLC